MSRHQLLHRLFAVGAPLFIAIPFVSAQTPSSPPPLLVNITLPLDISHLKIGSQIRTHVAAAWNASGCQLPLGALVQGHVSNVQKKSKADPQSAFTIVIDSAECNHGKLEPFKATLIALLGPDTLTSPGGMGKAPPLTDVPASISGGLRSAEGTASNYTYANRTRSLPSEWKVGMVIDTPMNLTVGKGAEGGSVIWSTTTDARLEGQTTLILLADTPAPTP
jgi:hypothetical protein